MMRRGASGGSSELLTPEQQRRIDEHCRADLARLGSDFPYDEVFRAPAPVAEPEVGSLGAESGVS